MMLGAYRGLHQNKTLVQFFCPTAQVIQLLDIAWRIQYHWEQKLGVSLYHRLREESTLAFLSLPWASRNGTAVNLWCDSIFGLLLASCETSPEAHGDANWSLFLLALVPLILACYFFLRFLGNAKD